MKVLAFLMCLLGSSLAAPAPDSGSNEQAIIGHANTALQLMELYRMLGHLQQQGFGAVPTGAQLPAAPAAPVAPAPADAQPQVSPQAPQQGFFFNPALFAPTGDGSDEEGAPQFRGFYPPYGYQPAQPAALLNSDEAEVAEEAEGAEAAEAGAEPEPAGTAATVDATAVNEIAPMDVAIEVPVEPVIAAVVPSLIPEVPAVAVEIDTTLVGPDAAGAEQVLVADAPDAALPVQ
ncbi:predicted GPI-anchored protein 58 [Sinocyclocheilus anshuiensis]|uniref:predicted GPI-anchored protein 58 n=1 Tax=Sinocyclocheilus anshuiensis TaxID=1608454 RepID=UPI0007B96C5E|nr:PREDICTED: predicted GPI-anchored protein 58 [Sinocyclocheilus anshuiensis]